MIGDLKIKEKYIDGKILSGAINENLEEVIPFVYDCILEHECYICKKDNTSVIYDSNGNYVTEIKEKYSYKKVELFGNDIVLIVENEKGELGIIGIEIEYKDSDKKEVASANVKVLYDFGKCDEIDTYGYPYKLVKIHNDYFCNTKKLVGSFRYDGKNHKPIIFEPSYRTITEKFYTGPNWNHPEIILVTGTRFDETKGIYVQFIAQKIGDEYIDLVNDIYYRNEIRIDACSFECCGNKEAYFTGIIRIIDSISTKLLCYCHDSVSNKLIKVFENTYDKVEPNYRLNGSAWDVSKDGKKGILRTTINSFKSSKEYPEPVEGKDYFIQEFVPCKYDELNNYDEVIIGTRGKYRDIYLYSQNDLDRLILKKQISTYDNNYVHVGSSHGNSYVCVRENGKIDFFTKHISIDENGKESNLLFSNVNYYESITDSIKGRGFIKTIKDGKVTMYQGSFSYGSFNRIDFSVYGLDANDITSITHDNDLVTIFFKNGCALVYELSIHHVGYICSLNFDDATPKNTKVEYHKSLNAIIIRHNDEFILRKEDYRKTSSPIEFLFEKHLKELKLDYNFELGTPIRIAYTEEENGHVYTSLLTSKIDYYPEPHYEHDVYENTVSKIESDIICGYCVLSKIDPKTKRKLYGVFSFDRKKEFIEESYANIEIKVIHHEPTFICTTFDGKTIHLDTDRFMVIPKKVRSRLKNKIGN